MTIALEQPDAAGLGEAVRVLGEWQDDAAPFQLHPGDLGWMWRFGAEATAGGTRVWRRGGRIVAVAELDLDESALARLGIAPDQQHDEELARRIAGDLSDPGRGVLGEGTVAVEVPAGAVRDVLSAQGWVPDEPWTPLARDLTETVDDSGLRVEVVGPAEVEERSAVQRSAFARSTFSVDRWHAMAAGPAYAGARCLLAYDDRGAAVATATVWSAGPGRPGLLEPMGVHREHRGRGHGRAITVAAARALQELGSSSATVCTPSANAAGVATYLSAGFEAQPERRDLRRS